MAYFGSTQLSSAANPPMLLARGLGGAQNSTAIGIYIPTPGSTATADSRGMGLGLGWWHYSSTNLTTDIVAANFFSDGWYLGMRPGDIVQGNQFTSAGSTALIAFTGSILSASTAGASLSTGSVMTSTFN
jgi:hypothetical protein